MTAGAVRERRSTEVPATVDPALGHRRREALVTALGYAAMVAVLVTVALPLYWIVMTSFKDRPDIYTLSVTWWLGAFHPENYAEATTSVPFSTFLRNSVIITGVLSAVKFVLGVLSAYGLVFLRFPGKNLVFLGIIAALMVPNQITVISNYALVAEWGWRNSFHGIIVPLAGVAFGTFLMRNHFLSIPIEIIEAARMDGAGQAYLDANPNARTAVDQLAKTRSQDYARVFVPGGDQIIGTGLEQIGLQNADVATTLAGVGEQLQRIVDRQITPKLPQ